MLLVERPLLLPPPQLLLKLNLGLWNLGGMLVTVPLDAGPPSAEESALEDAVVREAAPDGGLIASGTGAVVAVVPMSVQEVEVLFFFDRHPLSLWLVLLATAALLLLLSLCLVVVSAFAWCSLPVPFTSREGSCAAVVGCWCRW